MSVLTFAIVSYVETVINGKILGGRTISMDMIALVAVALIFGGTMVTAAAAAVKVPIARAMDKAIYSNSAENFKRPKNREDSSDLDENLSESIAAPKTFI